MQIAIAHAQLQLHAQPHADVFEHFTARPLRHEGRKQDGFAPVQAIGALLEDRRTGRFGIHLDLDRDIVIGVGNQRALEERPREMTEHATEARAVQLRQASAVMQRLARRRIAVEAGLDVGMQTTPGRPENFLEQFTFGRGARRSFGDGSRSGGAHLPSSRSGPRKRATLPPIFRKRCSVAGGKCL